MPKLRAFVLIAVFLLATVICIPYQAAAVRFGLKRRKTFPHRFHTFVCALFGFKVTIIGSPVAGEGVLMVANHTSWLDIPILSRAAPVSFVAKTEVAGWPLFGTLARLQETVFVERERRSRTGEARAAIRARLASGDALVLFPEGTSSDGNSVLPFKSALMGAAESEIGTDKAGHVRHVAVQPVAVTYFGLHGMPMGRENRPFFAWYGDMELMPHLWEAFQTGPLDVIVEFLPPMTVDAAGGRKALALAAEKLVRAAQTRALAGLAGA